MPAESIPLLTTSKRVSWSSGPGQLKIIHEVGRGVTLVPIKIELPALALSVFLFALIHPKPDVLR